jgi:uncharacterized protein YkwD
MSTPPNFARTGIALSLMTVVAVAFSTASAPASAPTDSGSASTAYGDPTQEEYRRRLLELVNDSRSGHDLAKLRINPGLSSNALRHTSRMVRHHHLSTTPGLAELVREYDATIWAENLAHGRTLQRIRDGWLENDATRIALLDGRFRWAAIGVVRGDGRLWVTLYLHD